MSRYPSPDKPPLQIFLERYWKDRGAGAVRGLRDYLSELSDALRRRPTDTILITREYMALESGQDQESVNADRIGPYRLIEEIGRGGQGVVYRAEDGRDGREIALKVLHNLGGMPELVARFKREGAVASKLEHLNICTVYDADTERGVPFIAMEFVNGQPLDRVIAASKEGSVQDTFTFTDFGTSDLDDNEFQHDQHEESSRMPDRHGIDRILVMFEKLVV